MKLYNITIAGTGYVGLVAGVCFAEKGHRVTCVDTDEKKVEIMSSGISPIYEAGLEELMQKNIKTGRLKYTTNYKKAYANAEAIFIGVGTPDKEDGSADLTDIETTAKQIALNVEQDCLIVVKSTVPVGTNDSVEQIIKNNLVSDVHIEVASNPEFLAQGTAVRDTLQASRIVIGTESKWAEHILREIYQNFELPIVSVNKCSSEMIKYASNNFMALKISYMNDIANLCELVGADIKDVARGMSYDKRIGDSFLGAGIGYGGSCLPKDANALCYLAENHGYKLRTIESAISVNNYQKTKLFTKASSKIANFNGLKTAILGLTFKPGTDDIRKAPAIENISLLLESGAKVYAFDPAGANNFKMIYPEGKSGNGRITYVETPEEALKDADICFIFTEWSEIRAITPINYKNLMGSPLVYDGRNIYNIEEMKHAGVEYYCIGRQWR